MTIIQPNTNIVRHECPIGCGFDEIHFFWDKKVIFP